MTDTAEVKGVTVPLDSGATGLFIDHDFAMAEKLTMWSLTHLTLVYNVDGMLNKGGVIQNVIDVILHFWDHSKCAIFAVMNLGKHKMIIGYPWPCEHHSEVNWKTQEVMLSWCPSQCHTCRVKLQKKALWSVPIKGMELVPPYLHNFKDIFTKESFDSLPESRTWDHVIELEPGGKPSACKVYPLAPSKHLQIDGFLWENLCTGSIHPLKSLMASPVFFIKKKDRSLWLV